MFFPPVFYASGFFRLKSGLWRLSANKSTMSLSPYITEAWEVSYNLRIFDTNSLCYAGVYKTLVKHPVIFFHGGNKSLFGG